MIAQTSDAKPKIVMPTMIGRRRPKRSLIGPAKQLLAERQAGKRRGCAVDVLMCRSRARSGSPGR